MVVRSYLDGPRWVGTKQTLFEACNHLGIGLKIIDHDKGWFRETIYFEVDGPEERLSILDNWIKSTVAKWNKE